MKNYYVCSWSGGKDSTFLANELLKRGADLDEIIMTDTGYEFPEMYDYILKVKEYWENKYPHIKITLLNWGNGRVIWDKFADGEFTKGEKKGLKRGFPYGIGHSFCTRELKVYPMQRYLKDKENVKYYIGIALNEPKRVTNDKDKLYPLVDWKITEDEIAQRLVDEGLHNPLYNHFHRTGCFLCPKQSLTSLYKLWKHYPNQWQEIVDMETKYKDPSYSQIPFKFTTTDLLVEKFKGYELKGKPTNYLEEEQPLGCFCK